MRSEKKPAVLSVGMLFFVTAFIAVLLVAGRYLSPVTFLAAAFLLPPIVAYTAAKVYRAESGSTIVIIMVSSIVIDALLLSIGASHASSHTRFGGVSHYFHFQSSISAGLYGAATGAIVGVFMILIYSVIEPLFSNSPDTNDNGKH